MSDETVTEMVSAAVVPEPSQPLDPMAGRPASR